MLNRFQVHAWSDIACPFCYIGRQQLLDAIERFPHGDEVELTWKSFQLNPDQVTDPDRHPEDYLTQERGIPLATVRQMNQRVVQMGRDVGLDLALDKAIIANTFDAHRAVHAARAHGRQDAMKARLMRAYFTDGLNVGDVDVIVRLGVEVGLDETALRATLAGDDFAYEVRMDAMEARQLGINGVPFFVLAQKYGVSGAQGSDAMLAAITQAHAEWTAERAGGA